MEVCHGRADRAALSLLALASARPRNDNYLLKKKDPNHPALDSPIQQQPSSRGASWKRCDVANFAFPQAGGVVAWRAAWLCPPHKGMTRETEVCHGRADLSALFPHVLAAAQPRYDNYLLKREDPYHPDLDPPFSNSCHHEEHPERDATW